MRRPVILAMTVLAMGLGALPAAAQVEECAAYSRNIAALVAGPNPAAAASLVDVGQTPRCFAEFLAATGTPTGESAFRRLLRRFEGSRSDRQAGTTGGSGSTAIVAQGPSAKVLSVAAEYGVLTQSTKDRTVTIRGNLAGLPSALVSHDVFPYCVETTETNTISSFCVKGSTLSVLRRFSFGVSFDPSRAEALSATPAAAGSSSSVTFTGSKKEVTGFNFRGELFNSRDTTSEDFKKAWKAKVGAALTGPVDALSEAGTLVEDVTKLPVYDGWRTKSRLAIDAAGQNREHIVAALTSALEELAVSVRAMPTYEARLGALQSAYNGLFLAQDELIDTLAKATVVALEYTQARPASQPNTSNYRLIIDYPFSKKSKVVANAAFTFYDSTPSDPAAGGRFRDAQAGVQWDHGLGKTALGPAVFSLAGYFQSQHAAAILKVDPAKPLPGVIFEGLPTGAKEVFTKTGNIVLAQARLALTPPSSSVTVPVSVTYSNRTELVDKPTWGAQVGLSYNVDALFAGLKR